MSYVETLGRLVWKDIHVYVACCETPDLNQLVKTIKSNYPCKLCRKHFKQNALPVPSSPTKKECVDYFWRVHNIVNKSKGKVFFTRKDCERYKEFGTYYDNELKNICFKERMNKHHLCCLKYKLNIKSLHH